MEKFTIKCKRYQKMTLRAFKQIVAEEQICPPCSRCEKEANDERLKMSQLERRSDARVSGN